MQDLITNEEDTSRSLINIDLSLASVVEMNTIRDRIGASMWHNYILNA